MSAAVASAAEPRPRQRQSIFRNHIVRAVISVVTFVVLQLAGQSLPVPQLLLYSMLRLIALTLWFYTGALFVYVLLSWFGDRGANPMTVLLGDLVEPILRPARRLLPPIGGLDLSPLIVILLLQAVMIALPFPQYLTYLR